jgi:hydrophobic/amphiphilic exporter-1 (mainly G- bacteria), HAE1 family
MEEIYKTLVEALILVIIVVFIFLQGWRATLIPLFAVPVSLVSTFALFPLLGFSVNTLSLLGLVLAIGLVVDDAIVVVEAVERHIEDGFVAPRRRDQGDGAGFRTGNRDCTHSCGCLHPDRVHSRYHWPALSTVRRYYCGVRYLLGVQRAHLKPGAGRAPLATQKGSPRTTGLFLQRFKQTIWIRNQRLRRCLSSADASRLNLLLFLILAVVASGWLGGKIPGGFVPTKDQGYLFGNLSLPDGASLQRTAAACQRVQEILRNVPGVQDVTAVAGHSLLSGVSTTYSGLFFVTLKPWEERTKPEEQLRWMIARANEDLSKIPEGTAFVFPPPAIPGIGTSGGATFVLEDRAGMDPNFLAQQTKKFIEAAAKRPEIARVTTTLLPSVPQYYLDVDQDKVLKQGVSLSDVYKTAQVFLGGSFVNYFNRFGRTRQVYVEADGPYRTVPEDVGQFYVRNNDGNPVPLSSLIRFHL